MQVINTTKNQIVIQDSDGHFYYIPPKRIIDLPGALSKYGVIPPGITIVNQASLHVDNLDQEEKPESD